MWQRRNAYLWLVGRTIRVLKQTRKWYGPVAFCQGHTEREGQWKKDWLSSPQDIRAKVPLLLDRYGLAGWRIHVVIGGPDMIWKTLPLATEDAADARELITGADLLDEEGRAYGFDLACPEKNRDGLYDWGVGAYPADWIEALCRSVVDAGAVMASLDLLPAFLGRLQPEGEGILSFQEGRAIHRVHLQKGRPKAYELHEGEPLSEGTSAFSWQEEAAVEGRPLPPTEAVSQVMERYGLSQATASLILL